MTTKKIVRRIVVQAVFGALLVALLTGGNCSPDEDEVNRIANEEASKRACGSLDINTVAKNLTADAKKSTCWAGFEENQTAAVCNAKNPPPAASWVCTECTAPSCENEPSQCSVCGASLSTKVTVNMSLIVQGYNVTVKGEVSYSAKVNFQNIIAKLRNTPEKTGTQPAFTYWFSTTDVTSTKEASISGELTAAGDFTGGVSLSTSFECAVGVNFRGGKSADQSADTCSGCTTTKTTMIDGQAVEECEPDPDPTPTPDAGIPMPDAPTPDAGTDAGIDAGYPAPDAGYPAPDAGYPGPDAGYPTPDAGTPYPTPDATMPYPTRSPTRPTAR
jgi:hypothetical protein